MNIENVIELLENDRSFMSSVTHWEKIPKSNGKFADFPPELDPGLHKSLLKEGINKLYSHQRTAYEHIRAGRNIVLVTPTASGKTLSYNLPVLQTLIEKQEHKAVYIFPTKALSQDQQAELNDISLNGDLPVKIYTYDGDTPRSIRISIRDNGRIIITNPDMLHTGILPNHPKWIRIMKSLKFVVLDEIHTYRGIFGSHMTNLIRRLKRIAMFYGTKPVFICCSATIGNPKELARNILEEDVVLLDENGAPSGERHFILYNPPLVDPVQGIRKSVIKEAQKIALRLLKANIKTIVFARSRMRTELIASYIKKSIYNIYRKGHGIEIASYRGGYLPLERRAIEKGLRDGTIQGVVSTNALELGIDIGGLDASILAGFPGSISSSWQQAGRAGRKNDISLSILIASSAPIDQYIINHPEYFFGRSPESAWIDADNIYILLDHLKCSVFELPFSKEDALSSDWSDSLSYLEDIGLIRYSEDKWYWSDQSYPAEKISLRTSTPGNVVIIDTTSGNNNIIGEMDRPSAKMMLFKGAIYIHIGNQYIVKELDIENLRCFVEESSTNFYTDSIVKTDIKVLQEDDRINKFGSEIVIGDVLVRNEVTKYKKIKYLTHENIGFGEIDLPSEEMNTRAVVLLFAEGSLSGDSFTEANEIEKETVIQRLGFVIKNVAPVFILCDPRDIGIAERLKDDFFNTTALYIYDTYPGGSGISEGFLDKLEFIIQGVQDIISSCPCSSGCPSCIGPSDEKFLSSFNPKESVIKFVTAWIDRVINEVG